MSKIIFVFKGKEAEIQCEMEEKIQEICQRFVSKIGKDINTLYFIYDGVKINMNLTLQQMYEHLDKKRNILNIFVDEIDKNDSYKNMIKSRNVICPKCNENIFINFIDYKINLSDCKNGHKINNISFEQYENTQNIDISKIICNICKKVNVNSIDNNEFYFCYSCSKNICPLCKTLHDKNIKLLIIR